MTTHQLEPQGPHAAVRLPEADRVELMRLLGILNRIGLYSSRVASNKMLLKLAALDAASAQEPQGWQPIETALWEGDVLVCYAALAGPRVAFGEHAGSGRWRVDIGYVQPTHWMPLPAPPKVTP